MCCRADLFVNFNSHVPCKPCTSVIYSSSQMRPVCRTMQYKHVGSPIFLDRTGEALPGEYMAFRGERPEWYTGSIGDHVSGYILGVKQAAECTVRP